MLGILEASVRFLFFYLLSLRINVLLLLEFFLSFMVCADYDAFIKCQLEVEQTYQVCILFTW